MNRRHILLGVPALITACSLRDGPPNPGTRQDIDALASAITDLSPAIDPAEARHAADLAYAETHNLAATYQITGPPLLHNAQVNAGQKPRGLCWHWAEDLEKRLSTVGYRTLRMHRAIANADNPLRIDHSTAIIAPTGARWHAGIVLDPWRHGGTLHWVRVADDTKYNWQDRETVLRRHGRIRYVKQGADT
ncbi:hypothetical protein [Sulfitobacter aestuariivivens]|uniref:Lipoprotein n=1 Tax=Sulfitobacter aestuariivivens TaxID=2766981 RepID=A0A927D1N1_9RHOB|nr:hypothetical protein [Sulfitobacter aestuariivivens]MBD3663395.1 hypothetical protein [Sulfitobacter aestuariivivens]